MVGVQTGGQFVERIRIADDLVDGRRVLRRDVARRRCARLRHARLARGVGRARDRVCAAPAWCRWRRRRRPPLHARIDLVVQALLELAVEAEQGTEEADLGVGDVAGQRRRRVPRSDRPSSRRCASAAPVSARRRFRCPFRVPAPCARSAMPSCRSAGAAVPVGVPPGRRCGGRSVRRRRGAGRRRAGRRPPVGRRASCRRQGASRRPAQSSTCALNVFSSSSSVGITGLSALSNNAVSALLKFSSGTSSSAASLPCRTLLVETLQREPRSACRAASAVR